MATQTLFNISPYYDDYDEDKNFLRMLFRPGYAVQARELTQAQTILQTQIERFGNHMFEDGARVLGAGITTRPVAFVRIAPSYTDDAGVVQENDITKLVGYDLTGTGSDGNVSRARVVSAINEDSNGEDNYKILFVEYMRGSDFGAGEVLDSAIPSEILTVQAATAGDGGWAGGVVGSEINGDASLVSIEDGIFFVDGFFVKSQNSSSVPFGYTAGNKRYFKDPTARVGFDVERSNVSVSDEDTLRDPASGSYNFNAPGADRYRVQLDLDFKSGATGTEENFIELLRYENGLVTQKVIKTNYAELENTLARRTYDESGSYTVRPFEIDMREHLDSGDNRGIYSSVDGGDENKLAVGLKSGKAYVFGYEYETQSTEYVSVNKARQTAQYTGTEFDAVHGNYFVCTEPVDNPNADKGIHWLLGRGDINKSPVEIHIMSQTTITASAKIHKLDRNADGNYRVYVYDIILEDGQDSLAGISHLRIKNANGHSAEYRKLFDIVEVNGSYSPNERDNNLLLFPVNEGSAVKNFDKLQYSFKKTFNIPSVGGTTTYNVELNETDSSDGQATYKFDTEVSDISKYIIWESTGVEGQLLDTELVADANISHADGILTISNLNPSANSIEFIVQATVVYRDIQGQSLHTNGIRTKSLIEVNNYTIERKETTDGRIYFELPHPDVYKIKNLSATTTQDGEVDFDPSNDLLFDNGQRDNAYLLSRLWVKESKKNIYTAGTGEFSFKASYEFFQHNGGPGPFVVDSYNGFTYDNIPLYTSKNLKKTFSLANVLDFRHTNPQFPNTAFEWDNFTSNSTSRLPDTKPRSSIVENHTYYLSRIDKVVLKNALNGDVSFDVIGGVDALVPKSPEDSENSMTLYTLTVPAYTHNPNDVDIKFVENKRYTMKDLGKVENRVNDLEYFTTLSLLENEIDARQIPSVDSSTDSAFKNGILVDGFRGHNIGDVSHIDYNCAVDYENGHLRPSFVPVNVGLSNTTLPDNLQVSDDGIVTYKIENTTEYINQPSSSGLVTANPFNLANWMGTVTLNPPVINWYDTGYRPTVKINSQGENDNWKVLTTNGLRGFGTQWNDWNNGWFGIDIIEDDLNSRNGKTFLTNARVKDTGIPVVQDKNENNVSSIARDVATTREEKNRLGVVSRNIPDHIQKNVGSKSIDVSVVPFIETQNITINANGLRPNTSVHCFFDGTNVDANCVNTDGTNGPYTTDDNGSLSDITFTIPKNTFETGEGIFRLIDDTNGKLSSATTTADGVLYTQGLTRQRDGNIISTRTPVLIRQTVKSEQVVKNPYMRRRAFDVSKYTNWLEPLSQIFYVDEVTHPNGMFLDSVDLFFATIDEDIPVKVDIRPTVNGIPSPSMVVPFSEVWKSGATYDFDGGTNNEQFKFSSPLYLEPGEYAIAVHTNSANYKLHSGEAGQSSIDGIERISLPIHSGSLFRATNSSEAEADATTNLKYKLNRCVFNGLNVSKTLTLQNDVQGNDVGIDSYQLNYNSVLPSGTSITNTSSFDNNTNIITGKSEVASSRTSIVADSDASDKFTIQFESNNATTTTDVSPILDMKTLSFVCVENQINNKMSALNDGTDNEEVNAYGSDKSAVSKYITRRVTLEDEFEAKNLKVFLDLNQMGAGGEDVNLEVYAKFTSKADETDFNDKPYVMMEVENNSDQFVSENEFDFREVSYTLPTTSIPVSDDDRIKSFAVKVCMYRKDELAVTSVPIVKDLRIVALDS